MDTIKRCQEKIDYLKYIINHKLNESNVYVSIDEVYILLEKSFNLGWYSCQKDIIEKNKHLNIVHEEEKKDSKDEWKINKFLDIKNL